MENPCDEHFILSTISNNQFRNYEFKFSRHLQVLQIWFIFQFVIFFRQKQSDWLENSSLVSFQNWLLDNVNSLQIYAFKRGFLGGMEKKSLETHNR